MSELLTNQINWALHRSGVVEGSEDTDLAADKKKWAEVIAIYPHGKLKQPVVDGLFRFSKRHNKMLLRLRTNGADGDTCTIKVYLFKKNATGGDDAKLAASIVVTFGLMQATMQIGTDTTLYADQAVVTSSFPNAVSSDSTGAGGNNMVLISADLAGHEFGLVLITASTMAGSGKKIAVDLSGW